MIKEIYIDNFKCLTNFSIQPGEFQLWLGANGSGKSTVFTALQNLRSLLSGNHVEDIFSSGDLTVWDKRTRQTFGVSIVLEEDKFDYHVTIEHFKQAGKVRIVEEKLKWNDSTFFLF